MKERSSKKQNKKRGKRSKKMRKSGGTSKGALSSIFGAREDPAEDPHEQFLFLLEFYVHRITGERLAKLNQMFFVPTCVGLQFLDFTEEDEIEITPVDLLFEPQAGIADDVEYFYSGKSVMFALERDLVTDKQLELIVTMTIRKKMPEGIKPDIMVGVGQFELTKQFAALRKEMLQCWHRNVPPPKTFEGSVPLTTTDRQIGEVFLHVRMSAFGETIITEFEAPSIERNAPTYIFKGDEFNQKSLAYKCKVVDCDNICQESVLDLPCRACVLEEHACLPCGRETGARARDAICAPPSDPGCCVLDPFKPASYPPSILEGPSMKQDMCTDSNKPAGPIQTSRGQAQACGKAVVLKVSGLLDGEPKKQPTVTVAPESDAIGPCNPPDPDHDVFILRIGKKGLVGAGEKSDLQLEMRTPKGPERRPAIRHETREIQTEVAEKAKKPKKGKKKKK
ncbi:hypothetical protein KPH14_002367 [Odynerus spinipes]|uniref:Uncharacterized protein n=1 Tax=Odynerus spinipes TaxID=1348599 RepID=A0AAD9VP41_9HYME|nr:hypothetical protein KPH14_002367 [Odynerus spinipes]